MSEKKKSIREEMTEAYKNTEKKDQQEKTKEEIELKDVDLEKASPFMLMKLGFQKLLDQAEKEENDE